MGYQLDQRLSLRLIDNVILDLPCVLPYAVHVDLEILETQGYWGFYLNHVHQLSLSLRIILSYLDNVLLELGGLPCVLPFAVHLDLGHLPNTQGYFGILSEPCTLTHTLQNFGWWVTAQRPNSLFLFGIYWGLEIGLGLSLRLVYFKPLQLRSSQDLVACRLVLS